MEPPSPPEPAPITAQVTVTGIRARMLRELAAVAGLPVECAVQDWATGKIVLPAENRPPVQWGVFEGPADLSERCDELLRERSGS